MAKKKQISGGYIFASANKIRLLLEEFEQLKDVNYENFIINNFDNEEDCTCFIKNLDKPKTNEIIENSNDKLGALYKILNTYKNIDIQESFDFSYNDQTGEIIQSDNVKIDYIYNIMKEVEYVKDNTTDNTLVIENKLKTIEEKLCSNKITTKSPYKKLFMQCFVMLTISVLVNLILVLLVLSEVIGNV